MKPRNLVAWSVSLILATMVISWAIYIWVLPHYFPLFTANYSPSIDQVGRLNARLSNSDYDKQNSLSNDELNIYLSTEIHSVARDVAAAYYRRVQKKGKLGLPLYLKYCSEKDPWIRKVGIRSIEEVLGKDGVETISKYLSDEDPGVRGFTLSVIIACDPMRGVIFAENMMRSDPDLQVRAFAKGFVSAE